MFVQNILVIILFSISEAICVFSRSVIRDIILDIGFDEKRLRQYKKNTQKYPETFLLEMRRKANESRGIVNLCFALNLIVLCTQLSTIVITIAYFFTHNLSLVWYVGWWYPFGLCAIIWAVARLFSKKFQAPASNVFSAKLETVVLIIFVLIILILHFV